MVSAFFIGVIMANNTRIVIKSTLGKGISKFKIKSEKVTEKALAIAGLQLLNFIVNGSPNESTTPPVLTGLLRGSGSVFVGNTLIGVSPTVQGQGQPNTSYSGKKNVVTVGFDTDYAAIMHEEKWNPGAISRQSGDVGNKFIERHLDSDKNLLMKLIAKTMEKEL